MSELNEIGAYELARRIRAREVSPVDAVDAAIERYRAVNTTVNAVVVERHEEARMEAVQAERQVARNGPSGLPPLFGVPFTVKEMIAVAGLPQTAGSTHRRGVRPAEHATCVRRLLDAGAILMGTTNVPEMGMWMETVNFVYGRSMNPYDPSRTPGGSSGGEAAAVSAGLSTFGIGSDIGGSIRFPAHCCALFGHKPTGGLVPLTGHFPAPQGRARRFLSIGPLTRHARDLDLVLRVLSGPDGRDRAAISEPVRSWEEIDFTWRRVIVVPDMGIRGTRPSKEIRAALDRAAKALAARGAEVEEWRPTDFARTFQIWTSMVYESEGPTFGEILGDGREPSIPLELAKKAVGRSRHTLPALALAAVEKYTRSSYAAIQNYAARGRRLRARLDSLLAGGGVMLLPTYPTVAPKHRRTYLRPLHGGYTAIFNVLETPATTVPAGMTRDGLPIGVQLVSARGRDDVTIAAAVALEEDLGGWRSPDISKLRTTPDPRAKTRRLFGRS